MEVLALVQAAATWALVGLIWTMQIVHYPLFAKVGRSDYPAWQKSHMRRRRPQVSHGEDLRNDRNRPYVE